MTEQLAVLTCAINVTACNRMQRLEAAVRDAAEAQGGAARQLPNAVGDAIEEMEAAMSVRCSALLAFPQLFDQ